VSLVRLAGVQHWLVLGECEDRAALDSRREFEGLAPGTGSEDP